ncbi:Transmembrane protein [Phytophthora palmivora]|uniref:Transmembrane protein n=1 Tax=Phytophthora palmivora TaxID=4796 RepID=A0A2P4XP39_9STRA|nr:Transmembrane protein [Phytophthora palmivora]
MAARPRASYTRIPPAHQHESDESDGDDSDHEHHTQQRVSRSQRAALWSTRLHAFLWVAAAGLVAYGTDFLRVIFTDPRVKRGFFQVALISTGINICITAYLAIYLPYIKRIQLEWSVYCPRMIPTATIVGVVAAFCYICAFWPVWGLLTPGLLGLFFIGTLMTAHFLPSI